MEFGLDSNPYQFSVIQDASRPLASQLSIGYYNIASLIHIRYI